MSRIIDFWALSWEERYKLRDKMKRINCGPDCECDTPKTGISIGRIDSFGVPFPDAVDVILDKRTNDWVVYIAGASPAGQVEAGRFPAAEVEAIRYLPNEVRRYSHWVLDE